MRRIGLELTKTVEENLDWIRDSVSDLAEVIVGDLDFLTHNIVHGNIDDIFAVGDTREAYIRAVKDIGLVEGTTKAYIVSSVTLCNQRTFIFGDLGANPTMSSQDYINLRNLIDPLEEKTFTLLNIGEEPYKGDQARKEAYKYFSNNVPQLFLGNDEGNNVLTSESDIVLTDGISGNILLKFWESMDMVDRTSVGGAKLYGINASYWIGHGSSTPTEIINFIRNISK